MFWQLNNACVNLILKFQINWSKNIQYCVSVLKLQTTVDRNFFISTLNLI